MTVPYIDLVDNNDGELTLHGYKFTRKAIVTDPEGQSAGSDDATRIFDAINDPGIPDINDPHPALASVLCKSIKAVAIEPNWIELLISYETPGPGYEIRTLGQNDVSMNSSLIQAEATKDFEGTNLTPLTYTYPIGAKNPQRPLDDDGEPNLLTSATTFQSELPVVPIYLPSRVYTIALRMTDVDEDDLELLNETYQGTVNDDTWRTYGARKWLCMGLNWRTTDQRTTYTVQVQFQYKFDTYDAQSVFRDPYSGKVPGDVFDQGSAFANYKIQRESDFDALLSALGV